MNTAKPAKSPPTISVVMSAFNSEKYIARAIQSILDQTFTDFEFIILNDGSTDATADIIRSFNDKRIRLCDYKKNLGLPTRLNQGFALATGAYIARMDADDWSFPQRFQTQLDYLEQHPDVDILGTAVWRILEGYPDRKEYIVGPLSIDTLPVTYVVVHPTAMLRCSTLPATVRYNPAALGMEDYQFWLDLLPHMKIVNLPDVLLEYHRHPNDSGKLYGVGQVSRAVGCALDFIQAHLGENLPQQHIQTVRSLKDATASIQLEKLSALYGYYKNKTLSVGPVGADPIQLTPWLLNALIKQVIARRMETLHYNWGFPVESVMFRRYFRYHFKLWRKRVRESIRKTLGLRRTVRPANTAKQLCRTAKPIMPKQAIPSSTLFPPTISVVMSALNAEKYIAGAIQSILDQTFTDFEFIILNDGSTDTTADLIRSFDDKRIRFVDRRKNAGLATRLNQGFALARGAYIARMDADDWSAPERFQLQVDFLEQNPKVGVLGTGVWETTINLDEIIRLEQPSECLRDFPPNCPVVHPTVMLRRSALPKDTQYDESYPYSEDYKLWLEMMKYTQTCNLQRPLHKRRMYPDSLSQSTSRQGYLLHAKTRMEFIQAHLVDDFPEEHSAALEWSAGADRSIRLKYLDNLYQYYENKTLSVRIAGGDRIRLTPPVLLDIFRANMLFRMETLQLPRQDQKQMKGQLLLLYKKYYRKKIRNAVKRKIKHFFARTTLGQSTGK